ncbi:hypothetical protein ONZ45_g18776 [Pleurotus djamor]|nr:hypothetical protein ONZ45_g18776 [Pleurotus djamor]
MEVFAIISPRQAGISRNLPLAEDLPFPITLHCTTQAVAKDALIIHDLLKIHGYHQTPISMAHMLQDTKIAQNVLKDISCFYPVCEGKQRGIFLDRPSLDAAIPGESRHFTKVSSFSNAVIFMLLQGDSKGWDLGETRDIQVNLSKLVLSPKTTAKHPLSSPAALSKYGCPNPVTGPQSSPSKSKLVFHAPVLSSSSIGLPTNPSTSKRPNSPIKKTLGSKISQSTKPTSKHTPTENAAGKANDSDSDTEEKVVQQLQEETTNFMYRYIRELNDLPRPSSTPGPSRPLPWISQAVNDYLSFHGYSPDAARLVARAIKTCRSDSEFAAMMSSYGPPFVYKEMKYLWLLIMFKPSLRG